MSWPLVTLGEIVENCNSKRIPLKHAERLDRVGDYDYYGASGVIDKIDDYLFDGDYLLIGEDGNNLISRSSPIAFHARGKFWVNNHAHVLKSNGKADLGFLAFYINSINLEPYVTGSAQPKLNKKNLDSIKIPLPPLDEQKRIAAILDKADAIRRKRQQAIDLADDFLRAVFLDMFGDPVTNPKGWKTACLEELVKVVSGATPSKSNDAYWAGEFPWVSPKDMKSVEISSSIDHVNQVVFERENLKKLPVGSVLIVVRGMILAHTVPVGITTTEVAINQDIKAFVSSGRVLPEFLLWFLLSQHANLLSKVTTAAHGTKRFDMVDLLGLPVFVPDIGAQRKFVSIVGSYKETLAELDWSHKNALQIFNSLSQKAFSGQL